MEHKKLKSMKGILGTTWFQRQYDKTVAFNEEEPMNSSSKDI